MLNVISLGAGVQSSTMALMAMLGEIVPMPDAAIFADTHDEPKSVYSWLDWLEKQVPFPVHRVSAGSLSARATRVLTSRNNVKYAQSAVPAYLVGPSGNVGIMMRQCTGNHKIIPIQRKLRELVGSKRVPKAVVVRQWIGISSDETTRMRQSRIPWIENVYPLIDKWFSRSRCIAWMEKHGFPKPPRSACVYCPFHRDEEWRRLQQEEPEAFTQAVEFEREYQAAYAKIPTVTGKPFLHKSLQPLDQIDFSRPDTGQLNLFENECEGLCGV